MASTVKSGQHGLSMGAQGARRNAQLTEATAWPRTWPLRCLTENHLKFILPD